MSSNKVDKYVYRVNYDSFKGVRVSFKRDEKHFQKYFSINDHSSWKEAESKAIQWRDKKLQRWERFCDGKDETIQYQGTNTGYPGISIDRGGEKPSLRINLRENGTMKNTSMALPPEDDPKFKKMLAEKMEQAKKIIDDYNRQRFGGRWYQYKKRNGLLDE